MKKILYHLNPLSLIPLCYKSQVDKNHTLISQKAAGETAAQKIREPEHGGPPQLISLANKTGYELVELERCLNALCGKHPLTICGEHTRNELYNRQAIVDKIKQVRNKLGLTFVPKFQEYSYTALEKHLELIRSDDFTEALNSFNTSGKGIKESEESFNRLKRQYINIDNEVNLQRIKQLSEQIEKLMQIVDELDNERISRQ